MRLGRWSWRALGVAIALGGAAQAWGGGLLRVPGDVGTIAEAIQSSGTSVTIELTSGLPYRELLDLRSAPQGLTIRAAKNVKPTLLADERLIAQLEGTPKREKISGGLRLLDIGHDVTIQGVRLAMDASIFLMLQGDAKCQLARIGGGKAIFEDCEFVVDCMGQDWPPDCAIQMALVKEPAAGAVFERCQWQWQDKGASISSRASALSIEGKTEATCRGCTFGAMPPLNGPDPFVMAILWNQWNAVNGGQARCPAATRVTGGAKASFVQCNFGVGAGNATATYCQVDRNGEPVTFEGCGFRSGYDHGVMLTGPLAETVVLDRCVVQASMTKAWGCQFFYAQPGGLAKELVARESAIQFYSTNNDQMELTRGRVARLEHCTLVDAAGINGTNEGRLIDVDSTTSDKVVVRNCLFVVPRVDCDGNVYDTDKPGRPLPNASGNMVLRRGLTDSLTTEIARQADPLLSEDMIHLLAGSPAIGAAPALDGKAHKADIEGQPRPLYGKADIGADQVAASLDLQPFFKPTEAWSKDMPTTLTADQVTMHRVQVLDLSGEVDACEKAAKAFLAAHPDSPCAGPVNLFLATATSGPRLTGLESIPDRSKITQANIDQWKKTKISSMEQYLKATSDVDKNYKRLRDPRLRPAVVEVNRLSALDSLGDNAGLVEEADRALARFKDDPATTLFAKFYKGKALAVLPGREAESVAVFKDYLSSKADIAAHATDNYVINAAKWGVYAAQRIQKYSETKQILDLLRAIPIAAPEKARFLERESLALRQAGYDPGPSQADDATSAAAALAVEGNRAGR
jgi:hypothetical protein